MEEILLLSQKFSPRVFFLPFPPTLHVLNPSLALGIKSGFLGGKQPQLSLSTSPGLPYLVLTFKRWLDASFAIHLQPFIFLTSYLIPAEGSLCSRKSTSL